MVHHCVLLKISLVSYVESSYSCVLTTLVTREIFYSHKLTLNYFRAIHDQTVLQLVSQIVLIDCINVCVHCANSNYSLHYNCFHTSNLIRNTEKVFNRNRNGKSSRGAVAKSIIQNHWIRVHKNRQYFGLFMLIQVMLDNLLNHIHNLLNLYKEYLSVLDCSLVASFTE